MRKKTYILMFFGIILFLTGCSSQFSFSKMHKLFYHDLEKAMPKVYNDNKHVFEMSYDEYSKWNRQELDYKLKIRNNVIDSLGLYHKNNWLLVNLHSHNNAGTYEETYIFFDNRCVKIFLPHYKMFDRTKNIREISFNELNDGKDVLIIYETFKNNKIVKSIDAVPTMNPYMAYDIIVVDKKRYKAYKVDSKDYIVREWM